METRLVVLQGTCSFFVKRKSVLMWLPLILAVCTTHSGISYQKGDSLMQAKGWNDEFHIC